jgi:MerR family transcriptional regulator, mercuric resistance operon regulatory protein
MRIGMLAASCNCPAETIRYYEKIGLLPKPVRTANGYRSYDDRHQKWRQFVLRSRALGFTQDEVRRLSSIADQSQPVCADVHQLLVEHIVDVRKKLLDLKRMEKALARLKSKCQDGTLNDCPVIDELMN